MDDDPLNVFDHLPISVTLNVSPLMLTNPDFDNREFSVGKTFQEIYSVFATYKIILG